MQMLDPEATVKWSFLGLTGAGCMTWLMRFLMKSYRTEKLENAINQTDVGGYERLEKEVKRLGRKCAALELAFKQLMEFELQGAEDMGALAVHVANMPCHTCTSPKDTIDSISIILLRMQERRSEKMRILQEDFNK
jgi:hypothetical protein